MSVAISAEGGCAVVEIPDAEGEVFQYEVRRLDDSDPGWRDWEVARRDDPEGEHSHNVSNHDGKWFCSCKAFRFNRDRAVSACKHVRSVREVLDFYKKLTGVES